MNKPSPAGKKKPVSEVPEEVPVDTSVKDLLKDQAQNVKAQAGEVISSNLKYILPDTASVNLGAIAFVCSLVLIGVAIPLGMKGAEHVPQLIPFMIPVLIFGVVWRSRLLGVLSIVLTFTALGAGYGSSAYYRQQEDQQKRIAEIQKQEELKRKQETVDAERKAAEEKKANETETEKKDAAEKKAAQAAAEEAEAQRTKQQFFKEQEDRQKKKAEEERVKADAAAAAKKRIEDEERRKRELAEAEILKVEEAKKRTILREEAKVVLAEKSLRLQEINAEIEKLETKIKVAKSEMDSYQTVLDRETSPKPPTEAELERARKNIREAKQDFDKLSQQHAQLKTAADKASQEKNKATAALEALSK
jgi:hypothetical protein